MYICSATRKSKSTTRVPHSGSLHSSLLDVRLFSTHLPRSNMKTAEIEAGQQRGISSCPRSYWIIATRTVWFHPENLFAIIHHYLPLDLRDRCLGPALPTVHFGPHNCWHSAMSHGPRQLSHSISVIGLLERVSHATSLTVKVSMNLTMYSLRDSIRG